MIGRGRIFFFENTIKIRENNRGICSYTFYRDSFEFLSKYGKNYEQVRRFLSVRSLQSWCTFLRPSNWTHCRVILNRPSCYFVDMEKKERRLLTPQQFEEAKARVEAGESKRKVAASFNISESTLRKRLKLVSTKRILEGNL